MKRLAPPAAAALLLAGCLGNLSLPGLHLGPKDELAGHVFPEQAPPASQLPEGALRVEEYAPAGEVPWENLEGGIWVLFNKAVVPLARLAEPAASSSQMSILPAAKGVFRWYGSRLLAFEPEGALAPATEYAVLLDRKLEALDGSALAGMDAFRFRTPPLELLALSPSGRDVAPQDCRRLELSFNHPLELATLRPFLRLEAGGREVPFTARLKAPEGSAEPDKRVVLLEPKRELPWDSEVSVLLLAGARPAPETYGTAEAQALSFHTLEPLRVDRSEVYEGLQAVEAAISFNHPLEPRQSLSFLHVGLPGYVIEGNAEIQGNTLYLHNLPTPFESSFQVTVSAGLGDLYGQKLAADAPLSLKVGAAPSYVQFSATGVRTLEKGYPPVAVVEFQNALAGSYAAGPLARPYQPVPDVPLSSYEVQSLPRNTRLYREVDLAPFLNADGSGSAFARWRFRTRSSWSEETEVQEAALRLQVSGLGLGVHLACDRLLVQAAHLADGRPASGARVILRGPGGDWRQALTDSGGLADLAFEPGELARAFAGSEKELELEVREGTDRLVYRPADAPSFTWNFREVFKAEQPVPVTYLTSDRGIYRPGETLSFFGLDRDRRPGGLHAHRGAYTVELWQGWSGEQVLARAGGELSATGRFWGSLQLPASMEPDEYLLVYRREGEKHQQEEPVKIAFFRRVAFALELSLPEGPKYMGERLEGRFSGRYLAGGAVNRGQWSYWWARREIPYRPPDPQDLYEGFRFGALGGDGQPYGEYYGEPFEGYYEDLTRDEGSLGGEGIVVASQKLAEGRPGRVYQYELSATIEDVDRQAVSKQAGLPVFTSELLIGGRLAPAGGGEESLYFVSAGEPFALQACALDPRGGLYEGAGRLEGRLLRENWKMTREKGVGGRVDTRWKREEVLESTFSLQPGGRDERGRLLASERLSTRQVGAYWIELRGKDRQGRRAVTRFEFYSTGAADVLWQRYDEKRIELVSDKATYRPGEKARLLIKSPLSGGRYLLTVEREGILESRQLELAGSTDTVEVELKEQYIPVVYVTLSSATGRTAPPPDGPGLPDLGKPRGCFGLLALSVDPQPKRIELEILKDKPVYRPGEEATLTVRASWQGRPLEGAEVALVAADRGVLDLIDFHLPDPLARFYDPGSYPDRVHHSDSRDLLIDPVVWKVRDLPGGDKEGEEAPAGAELPVRRDFRATAVFEPTLLTGRDGTVEVRFRLPDSLTTFRATALAARQDLFGRAESELRVSNPVNMRAALPRLLRTGDEATAGVVLTNLTGRPAALAVGVESDLLELREKAEKRVTLKPGESREVAFRLSAPRPGRATIRFRLTGEALSEVLETALNVEESAVREAFTVVGRTEDRATEGLEVPERFLGRPGEGLSLTLDSTLASSLTGAIRFLEVYPYDCLEQRTSKLFALVLYDWLAPDRGRIERELAALPAYQTEDGGFSFWPDPGHRASNYYVSLRTAHLLLLAGERGYPVPRGLDREALVKYLQAAYPQTYPFLQPYGLYVQALLGLEVRSEARRLLARGEALGLLGRGLLALALERAGDRPEAERLLADLRNFLRVGTRSVTLAGPVANWYFFGGELQAKAVLMMLYRRLDPGSQIVQALADDLLASHRKGYWYDTATTGWVLEALAEQLDRGREADFRARVLLGSAELAEVVFRGVSKEPFIRAIEAPALVELAREQRGAGEGPALPLTLLKEGRGVLYYAATLSYALDAAGVGAREEGIGLAVDFLDERGRLAGDTLHPGQVYRVRAVIYSSRDRDFLAVRLPMPAGAEAIDGSLATSRSVRPGEEEPDQGEGDYLEPVKRIYDDEVRFIFDSFPRGKREVSFQVRTTTPGTFRVPPATAELMYEEEVFGRTAGRTWRIAP
jgi:uncharacterized protein YfaS (alpha-2-macroglobulin family)